MERMRVRGCDDVWPCFMNRSMNGEGGLIHRTLADHDLALAVDEQQVRYAYPRKVPAKGIDPEMIGPFGVARGNVASEALCKAMAGKEAKRAGQPFLTMTAFFCGSAYLLALKWRRQVARLYGKESAHMSAVTEGAAFCLSPSRYEREYRALWARPA